MCSLCAVASTLTRMPTKNKPTSKISPENAHVAGLSKSRFRDLGERIPPITNSVSSRMPKRALAHTTEGPAS